MISPKAYAVALWRLRRFRVPDRLDWLHTAIVEYLEKRPSVDDERLGNWLGLVAWRKWADHEKSWEARNVKTWPELDLLPHEPPTPVDLSLLEEFAELLTPTQAEVWNLWVRGLNTVETGRARGTTFQAASECRDRIRGVANGVSG